MLLALMVAATSAAPAFAADVAVTDAGASVTTSAAAPAVTASLNVEGAPTLVSNTANSVVLEWNKVEAAASYIVKYSEKSVATSADENAIYDNETSPVTETGATVENLKEGATYYFAVVALDKDGNESELHSEELAVILQAPTADSGAMAEGFALVSVNTQNTRTITIEFSAALGSDPVEVKLQKTANSASIPVKSVVTDSANPTTATVTLDADLEGDSTYSLTVVSAKDANGATISEGVNAMKEFTTIASLPPAAEVVPADGLVAAPLDAAPPAGSGAVDMAAATEVPTGPKETLIVMLALVSGLGIVFALRRKAA